MWLRLSLGENGRENSDHDVNWTVLLFEADLDTRKLDRASQRIERTVC